MAQKNVPDGQQSDPVGVVSSGAARAKGVMNGRRSAVQKMSLICIVVSRLLSFVPRVS